VEVLVLTMLLELLELKILAVEVEEFLMEIQ
jgi:hypothetical protein